MNKIDKEFDELEFWRFSSKDSLPMIKQFINEKLKSITDEMIGEKVNIVLKNVELKMLHLKKGYHLGIKE